MPRANPIAEAARLRAKLVAAWRRSNWRAFGGTIAVASTILACWLLRRNHIAMSAIDSVSDVRANQHLATTLARIPLSLVVPAPNLPVWGAVAQVLIVGALAEVILGRRRAAAGALIAQYASTLFGRLAFQVGPSSFFGLERRLALVRDTGPSAAVVTLAIAVGVVADAPAMLAILTTILLVEIIATGSLAGREHFAAIVVGLSIGAAWRWTPVTFRPRATPKVDP